MASGTASGTTNTYTEKFTPTAAQAGQTFCSALTISRNSSATTTGSTAASKCVKVNFQWTVTPQTQLNNDNGSGAGAARTGTWSSTAETINAYPGDTATWAHRLLQNGPTVTNSAVSFNSQQSNGWTAAGTAQSLASGSAVNTSGTAYTASNFPSTQASGKRAFAQADVSKTFCDTLNASPNGSPANSGAHCVHLPYNYPGCTGASCTPPCQTESSCSPGTVVGSYGVVPQTSLPDGSNGNLTPGQTAVFNYAMTNNGPTKTKPTAYWAYVFTIPSGTTLPTNANSITIWNHGGAPSACATTATPTAANGNGPAGSAAARCAQMLNLGTGVIGSIGQTKCNSTTGIIIGDQGSNTISCNGSANSDPYPLTKSAYTVDSSSVDTSTWSLDVGDKICSYLVINPWSVVNDTVATTDSASNIKCYTIAKAPQIQLRGGDSWSGGTSTVNTSTGATNLADFMSNNTASGTVSKTACPAQSGFTPVSCGFTGSASGNLLRGSWSQYGLLTNGQLTGFGSGGMTPFSNSGAADGNDTFAPANAKGFGMGTFYCSLAFANQDSSLNTNFLKTLATGDCAASATNNHLGSFNATHTVSWPRSSAAAAGTAQSLTTSNLSGLSTDYSVYTMASGGTISSTASPVAVPLSVNAAIYIPGNVTIAGNLTYAPGTGAGGSYTSLSQVPNLTIIADNIYVSSTVTEIDATLVAKQALYTCDSNASSTGATIPDDISETGACSQQLAINGAVVSQTTPYLQRTYGGEKSNQAAGATTTTPDANGNPTDPAAQNSEVFNYGPNSWLVPYWDATQSALSNGDWTVTNQIELPARY